MGRPSRRPGRVGGTGAALLVVLALPAVAPAQDERALARLSLVERQVELEAKGTPWRRALEGGGFDVGEALRTGPEAVVRLDLPWMALSLGPEAVLRLPDSHVLSAALERGRALVEAPERDALKITTGEAEVRGRGRAVVRRQGRTTLVSCLSGRFHVTGREQTVTLAPGQGSVVDGGRPPSAPQPVPSPPGEAGLWPGADPVYVTPGEPLELGWKGDAAAYQVEVLPVGSEIVLLQRDVGPPPARIEIPWPGAFRWRVSARDGRGLEGAPSRDGLIVVDER